MGGPNRPQGGTGWRLDPICTENGRHPQGGSYCGFSGARRGDRRSGVSFANSSVGAGFSGMACVECVGDDGVIAYDCPQVVVGMIFDAQGVAIAHRLFQEEPLKKRFSSVR